MLDQLEFDRQVFEELFEFGDSHFQTETREDGLVTACLVRDGEILNLGRAVDHEGMLTTGCLERDGDILAMTSSAELGVTVHAEQNLFGLLNKFGVRTQVGDVLYTTVEPCTGKFDPSIHTPDCTTLIVASSAVREIVYAAIDPVQHELTSQRFDAFGVSWRQVQDEHIARRGVEMFNRGYSEADYQLEFVMDPRAVS